MAATEAFRDGLREARRSEWLTPFTSRATKQTAWNGAPDSDSRERGAGRGASCRKKHRKTGRSCCRSRTPSFADRVAAAPGSLSLRDTLCCSPKRAAAQLALRAQTVLAGVPDSDSRSVEREGVQAAAGDTVKWDAIAAAPALKSFAHRVAAAPCLDCAARQLTGGSQVSTTMPR